MPLVERAQALGEHRAKYRSVCGCSAITVSKAARVRHRNWDSRKAVTVAARGASDNSAISPKIAGGRSRAIRVWTP